MQNESWKACGLALAAFVGMLACTGGPVPTDPQPSAVPDSQGRLEVASVPPIPAAGRIPPADNRLSHQRRLTAPEPWGVREGTLPFRMLKPARLDVAFARRTRSRNRAFDGAPPVMGHSLKFGGEHSCLECHSNGMTIGKRIARPMSHVELPNCTQCHIEAKNEWLDETSMPANDFVGWWNEGMGERSMEGAPPTIPHSTFLRTSCLSCHGQFGYEGLRTNHPERANCLQCHIASE